MRYDLVTARQQIAALDKLRLKLTLANATPEFQHVTQLVTLLLHVNNPLLPAFVENAPCGISLFHLTEYQRQYLKGVLYESLASQGNLYLLEQIEQPHSENIYGVYAMGSLGSISQTIFSDLDIWICCRNNMPPIASQALEQKCLAIQSWAKSHNVEVNLFILDQSHFKQPNHLSLYPLSHENCGSAQYMLLLDEFYRSAIRLAGKPLLWLHIWSEKEQDYELEVKKQCQRGLITLNDWVDFGGLGQLSANEYFGASLWHLLKGIDFPYKSVIKILLLESYSAHYPNAHLISRNFKYRLLVKREPVDRFDPYLALLDQVTHYLQQRNDKIRLDMVRRCFYIKVIMGENVHKPMTHPNWRLQKLHHLAQQWGWTKQEIEWLNNHHHWKIKKIKQTYDTLVDMMMQSYRHILQFGRQHNIEATISTQDLSILTRKLYTAFEELPGKVTLLNPQLSHNLSEPHLTFIEVEPGKTMRPGWYVLNQAPNIESYSHSRYVEYNPNLNKLVAWAYFNGLLTINTNLSISSHHIGLETLRQFVTDLRLIFPISSRSPTNEELHHPCEIRNLVVVVNLVNDPTKKLPKQFKQGIQQNDLFSFGPEQKSLVGSIDLTYRNLWNEIRTLHFSGEQAILNALKVLSNKIYRGSAPPRSVQVLCYSQYYRKPIHDLISVLVHKCINIKVNTILQKSQIHHLKVAGKTWNVFFEERGMNLQEVAKNSDNTTTSQKRSLCNTQKIQNYPFELSEEINSYATQGFLQFFFQDTPQGGFNVYILDEDNNMEIYSNCQGRSEEKVWEILQLYTDHKVKNKNQYYHFAQGDFNFPQFYQIVSLDENTNKVIPF